MVANEEELALIKKTMEDVIDEKLGAFFIEREKHYQHHYFIEKVICYTEKAKGTIFKTVIGAIVTGILALIIFGVIFWGKNNISGK